jgi:hypothetical protein
MAQAVVQKSPIAVWNGTSVLATPVLSVASSGADVTPGNNIYVLVAFNTNQGGLSPIVTVSDGVPYTLENSSVFNATAPGIVIAAIYRQRTVAGGAHSIVCQGNAISSLCFGQCMAIEVSGDADVPADANGGASNSGGGASPTPTTGSTATLGQATEIAFAVLASDANATMAGITNPPTGGTAWTSLFLDTATTYLPCAFAYKAVAANTALSAAWGTLTNTQNWGAVLQSFKATLVGAGGGMTLTGAG